MAMFKCQECGFDGAYASWELAAQARQEHVCPNAPKLQAGFITGTPIPTIRGVSAKDMGKQLVRDGSGRESMCFETHLHFTCLDCFTTKETSSRVDERDAVVSGSVAAMRASVDYAAAKVLAQHACAAKPLRPNLGLVHDNLLIDELRRLNVPALAEAMTTDQLLRECERRVVHPDYEGMSPRYWKECSDDFQRRWEMAKVEREEWKRLAERDAPLIAPASVKVDIETLNAMGANPTRYEQSQDTRERGPSAVTDAIHLQEVRRAKEKAEANTLDHLDVDLLCADEESKR